MTGVPAMINSNARQRIVSLLTGPQPYAPSPGALSSLSRSEASRLATPRERRLTASETGLHAAHAARPPGASAPPLAPSRARTGLILLVLLLGLPIPHHVADAADPDVTRLGKPPTNS
jgi:hypothetical protein